MAARIVRDSNHGGERHVADIDLENWRYGQIPAATAKPERLSRGRFLIRTFRLTRWLAGTTAACLWRRAGVPLRWHDRAPARRKSQQEGITENQESYESTHQYHSTAGGPEKF
jgi:hypothetical protein